MLSRGPKQYPHIAELSMMNHVIDNDKGLHVAASSENVSMRAARSHNLQREKGSRHTLIKPHEPTADRESWAQLCCHTSDY